MKKGFPNEVRIVMSDVSNGYCCVEGCLNPIHSHHHKLPQTEYYIKKYPLFIHSVFNDAPVCEYHHVNHRKFSKLNISEKEARVFEDYLRELKEEK